MDFFAHKNDEKNAWTRRIHQIYATITISILSIGYFR